MTGHTLKSKLVRIIGTTMLAVGSLALSIMGWTSYTTERERLDEIERQIRETISSEAAMLAASHALALKGLVADNAFGDVGRLVSGGVRNDSDVIYGLFIAADGKPWAYISPRGGGTGGSLPEDVSAQAGFEELEITPHTYSGAVFAKRVVHAFGEEIEEYSAPVVADDGERLGTVVYGFSNQRMRHAVAAAGERSRHALGGALLTSGAVGLLCLVIGIVWVLSSAARITRPVVELTAAAQQISAGKRGIRVSIASGDEIETLAAAFNQMQEANEEAMRKLEITTEQALAADRMKSEFLANTSHEIRTPMNGVLGMIQLIQGMPLDGKLRRYVDTIGASANALLTTINDILDFSKMEAGKLTLHPVLFDPGEIAQEVAELLAGRAHDKGFDLVSRFSPALPAYVVGDPDRFRQVLNNLVGNAVKFTERGEVFLDLDVASREAKKIVLRVAVHDTGIGIEGKDLPRLYSAFSQVDGTRVRRYGGTGLGLAICKSLVTLMDGEMQIESRLGEGSVFTFTARFEIAERDEADRLVELSGKGRKVLVVEPNRRWREVIEERLSLWQMQGENLDRGAGAVDRLRQAAAQGQPFDAAVLSANLSDVAVAELVRTIRADAQLAQLILVVVSVPSAAGLPDLAAERVIELHKPIRSSELYGCLVGTRPDSATGRVQAARHSAPQQSGAIAIGSPGRILVVDDNDINRFVAVEELRRRGYHTDEATNGIEALQKVKSESYVCVLMDCQMPVMDGCDSARAIRQFEKDHGRAKTPIIALTAHALIGERERVLAAGMDDFLSKPFRSSSLDSVLKLHVKAETLPPPSAAALFDLDPLVNRSEKLIRLFLEKVPRDIERLRSAIEKGTPADARAIAHKIKGSSLALAANRMSKTAEAIQRQTETEDLRLAAAGIGELEREYDSVARLLVKELAERSGAVGGRPASGDG